MLFRSIGRRRGAVGSKLMRGVATAIGIIHFIGIGGIGMSGIAEVMHNLGYQVKGSDIADGYVVEGLRKRGPKVAIGQSASPVDGAAVLAPSIRTASSGESVCTDVEISGCAG